MTHENSNFYLRYWGLIEIQLQHLHNFIEVPSMETHHIFGYPRPIIPVRDLFLIIKQTDSLLHVIMYYVLKSLTTQDTDSYNIYSKASQKKLTILQNAQPSVLPQQQCSASQNSGPHGRHEL